MTTSASRSRCRLVALVLTLGAALTACWPKAAGAPEGVSDARYARLARGLNLSTWFWHDTALDARRRATFLSEQDVRRLRRSGITHVRLPFSPTLVAGQHVGADAPVVARDEAYVADLERAVDLLIRNDVAVVLDLHPRPVGSADGSSVDFSRRLSLDPAFVTTLEANWTYVARRFQRFSPEMLFFELMNEPSLGHPVFEAGEVGWGGITQAGNARWRPLQARVLASVRAVTSRHTVILSGDDWGSVEGLLDLKPYADRNVVYSAHVYTPMIFTHQGAAWAPLSRDVRGLSYPADPRNCMKVEAALTSEEAREAVRAYCREGWNEAAVEALVSKLGWWSRKHNVRVWVGETGAYPEAARREDVLRYVSHVTAALERQGVGWAVWDDDWFGLLVERDVRTALRLR